MLCRTSADTEYALFSHRPPTRYSFVLWLSIKSTTAAQYWPVFLVICWTGSRQSSTMPPFREHHCFCVIFIDWRPERIEFRLCVTVYCCLNCTSPSYLADRGLFVRQRTFKVSATCVLPIIHTTQRSTTHSQSALHTRATALQHQFLLSTRQLKTFLY